ncbi:MAG: hypothetical protein HYX40_05360 [Sphingobacteriales bacterium]|nr:hypothetical protein [Sphingobacteriales bacterium]
MAFFTSLTETHELLRLPLLVKHYFKHQKADNNISLLKFLYQHYASKETNDTDEQEDNELPFKTYNTSGTQVYNRHSPEQTLNVNTRILIINYPIAVNQSLLPGYNTAVFHPPKIS